MRFAAPSILLAACGSSVVAVDPSGLVATSAGVYWSQQDDGALHFAARDSTDTKVIAKPIFTPFPGTTVGCFGSSDLHTIDDVVYWSNCGFLARTTEASTHVDQNIEMMSSCFAVDTTNAYGGIGALFAYPLDGERSFELTTMPHLIQVVAVLGDQVYFTSINGPADQQGGVWRVGIDGTGETRLLVEPHASRLAVDPSGLFFSNDAGMFRAELDGSNVTHIGERSNDTVCSPQIANGRVFWVNPDNTLVSVALDGTAGRVDESSDRYTIGPAAGGGKLYMFEQTEGNDFELVIGAD